MYKDISQTPLHSEIQLINDEDLTNMSVPSYRIDKVKKIYMNKKVRKWTQTSFVNQARKDGLLLRHWRPSTDSTNIKPYPFAGLNNHLICVRIDLFLYDKFYRDDQWTPESTDYFLNLCTKYDMKFIVIHDDLLTKFPEMNLSVLDLKNRYVNICKINEQIYGSSNAQQWHFDSDYEKQRRYLLDKYQKQTLKEIEKEQYIEHELSKIHARRDEMKKKLESLVGDTSYKPQNMMDNYENGKDEHSEKSEESNGNIPTSINPPYDAARAHKKYKLATRKIHSNTSDTSNTSVNPATKITSLCNKIFNPYKFPDNRPVGISLRSQRYKIPQSVGSRRIKALSSALLKLNIDIYPPATREVCEIYCALRSDLIALYDLKHALISLEFEYQKLKHKFYTSCPDVSFPFKDDPIENFKISYIDDVSYNIKADK